MLFKTAASVAILAGAATAAAEPKPYKLAMMPVLGQSLARRQTNGYVPDEQQCGDGATCAEACGAGFDECPSNDNNIHCFNPQAGSTCCSDGAGNSCDAGYYCTHDTKKTTWCCPDSMDLAACAAAYTITGGLETAASTTSTKPTTTATPSDYSTPETTTSTTTPKTTTTEEETTTTTYCPPTSAGYTTAWTGSNSTITSATLSATPIPPVTETPAPVPVPTGAASSSAVSMLLLVAAGAVALL